jgi:hypothetical protein
MRKFVIIRVFLIFLCFTYAQWSLAGEVEQTVGIQLGVPKFIKKLFTDKSEGDEEISEYSEGLCLGFMSVNCFSARQNSNSRMQVTKTDNSLIINFGLQPGLTNEPATVHPPRILPLSGITSKMDLRVYGGLTEIIPDSGIYVFSMHVLKSFGLQRLLSMQKSKIKLHFYLFQNISSLESSHGGQAQTQALVPDLVFFSIQEGSEEKIRGYLQTIRNSPSPFGPDENWISWHFAQNAKVDEERFSTGAINRKTADGNYFILDLEELKKPGKSLTHASSGALIQNKKSGNFFAIVQCYKESASDVYAFNLESLDPDELTEVDQSTLENLIQHFEMPVPFGLQSGDCIPLDGGPGDRKGGGGSYGPAPIE